MQENIYEQITYNANGGAEVETQLERIKEHLERGQSITGLKALDYYGIYRLSAYIHKLRKQGYNIKTIIKKSAHGGCYAEYRMEKSA